MKINYIPVVACILFISFNYKSRAQSLSFLNCPTSPFALCMEDPGVRLPSTNQFYLGENDPSATSCSAHVSRKLKVNSDCGGTLRYDVRLILFDSSVIYTLQPETSTLLDSIGEAELSFDTELSPEQFIREAGLPYTSGCYRYHRIVWNVQDDCGNEASCEERVDLYDCVRPLYSIAQTYPFVVQATITGYLNIKIDTVLKDVIDDCSRSDEILVSLLPGLYQPDSITHLCNEPAWGVEIPWLVYVADKGRDLNCNGDIEWNERQIYLDSIYFVFVDNGITDCGHDIPFGGQILTETGTGVANVKVYIQNNFGMNLDSNITSEDGVYHFSMMPSLPYIIYPERNDNHKNGVSTLDLVTIQKHLLGIKPLISAYSMIAADVNNSQFISAIDMLEIRKLILGVYSEFPDNTSWRFVPERIVINDLSQLTDLDFIGVKIGDVNNTVIPN